jgi:uncharacterized damage-inducible protein DinB
MTLQDYLSYFDEMIRPTAPLFRLVPSEKLDWKPTERSFTAGQLMAHMAGALAVYGRGISTGDWGYRSMRHIFLFNRRTPSMKVDEAVDLLEKNTTEFRRLLRSLSEEEFSTGIIDSPQLGRVPRWRAAMLAVEHHVNHKAELFMYLKLLGVDVHTGHLYTLML